MLRIPRAGFGNAVRSILPTVLAVMNVSLPPMVSKALADLDKCKIIEVKMRMIDNTKRSFGIELV